MLEQFFHVMNNLGCAQTIVLALLTLVFACCLQR